MKKQDSKIASLQVRDYSGVSVHCYGRLVFRGESENIEHQIEYAMTRKQARAFNSRDEGFVYKAGDTTGRFWSREDLYAAAKAKLSEFPSVELLVVDFNRLAPSEIIWAKDNATYARLHALHLAYEAMYEEHGFDPYKYDAAGMDRIEQAWEAAINEIEGVTTRA